MALTDGLVSHWRLDEASGSRADAHGSVTLSDVNTVGSGTGLIGTAADFESSNSGGECLSSTDNASLSLGGDTPFTWALWFKAESFAGLTHRVLLSKSVSGGVTSEYQVYYIVADQVFEFRVGNNASEAWVHHSFPVSEIGTWHLLIAWHDPDQDKICIQIDNGTPVEEAWAGGTFNGTGSLNIGRFPFSTGLRWDGMMDSISFWKRVLTPTERAQLYGGGAGLDYPFTVGETHEASAVIAASSSLSSVALRVRLAAASSAGSASLSAAVRRTILLSAHVSVVSSGATSADVTRAVTQIAGSISSMAGIDVEIVRIRLLRAVISKSLGISVAARGLGETPPQQPSPAHRMLRAGVKDLLRHYGEPFTVEDLEGEEFTGVITDAAIGTDLALEGLRPTMVASLLISDDVPWTPKEGRRLQARGKVWLIAGPPERGPVSWTIPLGSPDA